MAMIGGALWSISLRIGLRNQWSAVRFTPADFFSQRIFKKEEEEAEKQKKRKRIRTNECKLEFGHVGAPSSLSRLN